MACTAGVGDRIAELIRDAARDDAAARQAEVRLVERRRFHEIQRLAGLERARLSVFERDVAGLAHLQLVSARREGGKFVLAVVVRRARAVHANGRRRQTNLRATDRIARVRRDDASRDLAGALRRRLIGARSARSALSAAASAATRRRQLRRIRSGIDQRAGTASAAAGTLSATRTASATRAARAALRAQAGRGQREHTNHDEETQLQSHTLLYDIGGGKVWPHWTSVKSSVTDSPSVRRNDFPLGFICCWNAGSHSPPCSIDSTATAT